MITIQTLNIPESENELEKIANEKESITIDDIRHINEVYELLELNLNKKYSSKLKKLNEIEKAITEKRKEKKNKYNRNKKLNDAIKKEKAKKELMISIYKLLNNVNIISSKRKKILLDILESSKKQNLEDIITNTEKINRIL